MDRVSVARAALSDIVRRVAGYFRPDTVPGVETAVITDAEHDQYGLFRVGWRQADGVRVFDPVFLARIKDGKVWIEEDNTDLSLADELQSAGVPAADIVLAFHPPALRPLTAFAAI